jgi:hypothetical protein
MNERYGLTMIPQTPGGQTGNQVRLVDPSRNRRTRCASTPAKIRRERIEIPGGDPLGKKSVPPPPIFSKLSDAQEEEVRWLFCLAIPNMGKGVPAEVRSFFSKLIA